MGSRAEWTEYAVHGWGVGELWTRDGVVLAHEFRLRRVRRKHFDRPDETLRACTTLTSEPAIRSGRSPAIPTDTRSLRSVRSARRRLASRGEEVSLADVPLDLDWTTPFQRAVAERPARGAARRGRELRRARGARRVPGSGPRRRELLRGEPLHVLRARVTASSARAASAATAPRASASSDACSRSKESSCDSEDVREELARIAPARECDRLAELSALFHSAGSLHLRGTRRVGAASRSRERGGGSPRLQPAARCGDPVRDPHVPASCVRQGDPLPAPLAGSERTLDVLVAAGVLDRRHRPLERPPRRVVARACCRAAYLRGAFLGGGSLSTGRSPHLELRTATAESAELLRRGRGSLGRSARRRRAPDARRRLREELGRDRVRARARGRKRGRARARGARRGRCDERPREPPGERRSREPRPHEPSGQRQLEAVRSASLGGRCRATHSTAAGGCRAPTPSSRRTRCASSRRAPTPRRARRRCTAGSAGSRSLRAALAANMPR